MDDDNQSIQRRYVPRTELDFNLMTTDAVWGKSEINDDLKNKLSKFFAYEVEKRDEETGETIKQQQITTESLWGLLGYYTRDIRLANLSVLSGELEYCRYFLNLAGDYLKDGLIEPFLICLSRVADVTESSQAKNGFLRRRMHTFTQEMHSKDGEPPKKTFFGTGPKKK